MNESRTCNHGGTELTQPRSGPVLAGEVIAETVSLLMDAGVHPSEIRKHLESEVAWIDREMARIDAPSWSA